MDEPPRSAASAQPLPGPVAVLVKRWPKLSETFVLEEVLGLERAGLDVCVVALEPPSDDLVHPEVADFGGTTHQFPGGRRAAVAHLRLAVRHPVRYSRTVLRARRQLEAGARHRLLRAGWVASVLRSAGVAHLHSHFASEPTSIAELVTELSGLPFSISAHAKDIYLQDPEALRRKIDAASFTTTCTAANADHLRTIAPAATVVHIPHGVHLERFPPAGSTGTDDAPPTLVGVGRLRRKKGFDLLIEATAILRGRGRHVRCRIIGYGPELGELQALAQRLDVADHVTFEGKRPRSAVLAAFADADVVVQPCRVDHDGDRDGIPNVIVEAMALGRPVVTTAVSGIPELVSDRVSGRVVEPDDATALADAIDDLVSTPDEAARLGAAGRRHIETWPSVDQSCRRLAGLFAPRVAPIASGSNPADDDATVAYVVKGYPRRSELFIANEIHRVEQLGLTVRLFAIKHSDEPERFETAERVSAQPHYLPAVTSISGQSAYSWMRANAGVHRRAFVRVAARRPGGLVRAASMATAQAWRARQGRRLRKVYLKEFAHAVALADRILADAAIRHLHAHFAHGATTVTWLAASITGRSFSFTAHAKDIYEERLNPAGLLARKLRSARFAATCTEANRVHLLGIEPGGRVETIYHGLNDEMARHIASSARRCGARRAMQRPVEVMGNRGIGEEEREAALEENTHGKQTMDEATNRAEILAVGRHVAKKGFDTLVAALGELRAAGYDARLRIIGSEGEATPALLAAVAEGDLAHAVSLEGSMSQRELFAAFERATVFALPCRVTRSGDRDGIPNVLLESMAAGTAVVSTSISGIPELVIDGETGLLVDPDDPHALAKAIARLIDEPELRQTLEHAAVRQVETAFDGWAEAGRLVDLLRAEIGR